MKEKLTRNLGVKILSVVLAALLWLIITNAENPIKTETFHDVPVTILHKTEYEYKLKALNQVYRIVEGDKIDFTFSARRKIADNLTISDFKVTADLSNLSELNTVTINISCPAYGDDVTIKSSSAQVLKVEREQLAEKRFKVNVKQKGEPADGYYVYQKAANTLITVSGPVSKINQIAEIVAEVDVTGEAGSFRISKTPKALDEEGNEVDPSNLTYSENPVSIDIKMYKTKTIDLKIVTTGTPANGYAVAGVDYEPKTIEVAGEDYALSQIWELTVEEDIEGVSSDVEKEINIQEQLDDGLILVGDNQTATVEVTIKKSGTREMSIQTKDIEVRNKPDYLKLVYLTVGPVTLRLTGPADAVEDLSVKDVKPYIDLSSYTAGTYQVNINTDISKYISMDNKPTVSLHLQRISDWE